MNKKPPPKPPQIVRQLGHRKLPLATKPNNKGKPKQKPKKDKKPKQKKEQKAKRVGRTTCKNCNIGKYKREPSPPNYHALNAFFASLNVR